MDEENPVIQDAADEVETVETETEADEVETVETEAVVDTDDNRKKSIHTRNARIHKWIQRGILIIMMLLSIFFGSQEMDITSSTSSYSTDADKQLRNQIYLIVVAIVSAILFVFRFDKHATKHKYKYKKIKKKQKAAAIA
jgi:hypothetical protein